MPLPRWDDLSEFPLVAAERRFAFPLQRCLDCSLPGAVSLPGGSGALAYPAQSSRKYHIAKILLFIYTFYIHYYFLYILSIVLYYFLCKFSIMIYYYFQYVFCLHYYRLYYIIIFYYDILLFSICILFTLLSNILHYYFLYIYIYIYYKLYGYATFRSCNNWVPPIRSWDISVPIQNGQEVLRYLKNKIMII